MASKDLIIRILGDASGLQNALKAIPDWVRPLGAALTGIGATITAGLGVAVHQFAEAEESSIKLDAVLKSTGGAAGVTRKELDDMATSLSRVTAFDDDAITGAQALMLTFTGIGKDVFPQATEAALNMSTVLGQDLQQSTIQLGKALNDPVAGITALKRAGVSFTEDQKELIKTLVESGDKLGAQKIILQELATEFGGAAKAEAQGFAGQMAQLQNELGNVVEQIGGALVPALSSLLQAVKPIVISVVDWTKENPNLTATIVGIVGGVGALATALGPLLLALPTIISLLGGGGLTAVLGALTGPIGLTVAAIAGLVAAGVALYQNSETVRDTLTAAWGAISGFAKEVWTQVSDIVKQAAAAILAVWNEHKDTLLPIIQGVWKAIQAVFTAAFTTLKAVLSGGLEILSGIIEVWSGLLTGDFSKFTEGLGKIWDGLWKILAGMVKAAQTTLEGVIAGLWEIITGLFDTGKRAAYALWEGFWRSLANLVDTVKTSISNAASAVWNGVKGFFQSGKDAALALWNGLWSSLANVVNAAWNSLKGAVKSVTDGVTGFFKGMYDTVVGHSIVPDMMKRIGEEFGKLGGLMVDPTRTSTGQVQGIFGDLNKGIVGQFLPAWAKNFEDMFSKAQGFVKQLEGLLGLENSPFSSILNKVQAKVQDWVGKIGEHFQDLLGKVGGWITDLGSKIGGFLTGNVGTFLAGGGLLAGGLLTGGKAGTGMSIAGGAILGAKIGSFIVPGIGTAIGAGIGALAGGIASLFGHDQDKIDDTKVVEEGWPKIWSLQNAYANAPAEATAEAEVADRQSILGAGVEAWNAMVQVFKRPESRETQRPYIFDWIEAVNKTFSNRIAAFPEFDLGSVDLTKLPVQPMARGGFGTVTRPTLFLAGEAGPERFAFQPASSAVDNRQEINVSMPVHFYASRVDPFEWQREFDLTRAKLLSSLA